MKKMIKNIIIKILGEKGSSHFFFIFNRVKFLIIYITFKYKINQNKRIQNLEEKAFRIISLNNKNLFFGYYDKSPFNDDDTKMLVMSTKDSYFSAYANDKAEILLIDLISNNIEKITETETWNWQQGCRLQWHPKEKNKIIYNKIIEGEYGCEIYDIYEKKPSRKIKFPFYEITIDGKYLISLNFSRLQRLRKGYGYSNLPDLTLKEKNPASDGVWIYDVDNNIEYLGVSLSFLSQWKSQESMKNADHYINHISINPFDEDVFLFFHLWKSNNIMRSRAVAYNIKNKKLELITNEEFVSHYAWKSRYELLIFSEHKKIGKKYYLYNLKEKSKEIIGNGILNEDGHPTFFKNRSWLLTDTYPNKNYYQKLIIYDYNIDEVASSYNIPSYPVRDNDYRCDLHPRLSNLENLICFDTNFSGNRNIVLLKIEN